MFSLLDVFVYISRQFICRFERSLPFMPYISSLQETGRAKMIKQGGRKYIFPTTTKKPGNPPNDIFCNILRATLNQGKVEESVAVKINDCTKQVVDIFLRTPLQRHHDHHHHYNQLILPTPHHHRFD